MNETQVPGTHTHTHSTVNRKVDDDGYYQKCKAMYFYISESNNQHNITTGETVKITQSPIQRWITQASVDPHHY